MTTDPTSLFIQKARGIHGDKYDYSQVNYVNSITRVIVICATHGHFQQTPSVHLMGCGCPGCGKERTRAASQVFDTQEFIARAQAVHGTKYHYPAEYVSYKSKLTIRCPAHGDFQQSPDSHLRGQGCKMCALNQVSQLNRFSHEQFARRAAQIHKNKYSYDKFVYVNAKTAGVVVCPVHGEFCQKPAEHVYKRAGCPLCKSESLDGHYSRRFFEKYPQHKDRAAHLYVITLSTGEDKVIKVGITAQALHDRLIQYGANNYVINYTKSLSLIDAYEQEQKILTVLQEYKVRPNVRFSGHTECLAYDDHTLAKIYEIVDSLS